MTGGQQDDSGMLAAMGVPPEMWEKMREKSSLEIYPENASAVEAFVALQTQWRTGMNGREGLIYSEVYGYMDEIGITRRRKRKDLLWALRVMEGEVLNVLAENRKS